MSTSRRDFFRLAGLATAGGSVVFAAACGDDDDSGGGSTAAVMENGAGGERDVMILNAALDLENTAIAAYTAGAALLKGWGSRT